MTINNGNWEGVIARSHECIIFADEDTGIVKTPDFAAAIRGSDNYYVLITREDLPNLPYSVEEIYGIHVSGKYAGVRQVYNSFYRLYGTRDMKSPGTVDMVLAEDTNSGFEFLKAVVSENMDCVSAGGKTKIRNLVKSNKGKSILVFADGAAFGAEIGELYLYMKDHPEVCAYLPESFEWIILSSGLIDGKRVEEIINNTESHLESADYFSWEQYYTKLLVHETKYTYLRYSKSHLNEVYLHPKEKKALLDVIEILKPILET